MFKKFADIIGMTTCPECQLAKELGIADKVTLCNGLYGDELVGAYQQADVLLSSSIWELHSQVVIEALAVGLPVVVTNVSGNPDVIENGVNGYIVEPGDIKGMSAAILKILTDDQLQSQMCCRNKAKAEHYDWARINKEYLKLLDI